ncbi:MAG: ankyrin repeat domain-containing protein [Acidobacteria bacterium]|nr:ankyrin repeat domain-containing protein [Acidobacteriota bacterium]
MVRRKVIWRTRAAMLGALSLSALMYAASPDASIADAAMQGDKDTVRALLKQAADVNAAQGDGMTALHWAAMKNDAELTQILLYAGANVRATTRIGSYTPLILAAQNGNAAVMEPLIKGGADVNARTSNGTTPLMFASASGNVAAVTALLDHGADAKTKESTRGLNAAMFAAASDRAAVIKILAGRGADLKATTNIVDLNAIDRASFAGILFGNPAPPPAPGAAGGRGPSAGSGQGPSAGAGPGGRGAPAADGRGAAAPQDNAQQGRNFPGFGRGQGKAGIDRNYQLNELVSTQGGMTPLLLAARQGYVESAQALLDAGADINQASAGDKTSPLLIATLNGHFDLAKDLLDRGADPMLASDNGATPLYAALNCEWAPKSLYPQPRAYLNQKVTYLDLMKALLDNGADPNVRLTKKIWYSGYSFDLSGVDEIGATPFWRAAYASDVNGMKLLVSYGADPNIRTMKGAGRPRAGDQDREVRDVSPLPPVAVGGPGVTPLQAAAGVGYGEGFAANSHRFAPGGMLAAVKYLVEELHADVNAADHEGNTALHHAAARGDVEMIQYLVSKGADVMAVSREGRTVADMANGPVQRIQPWPEALALLEKLGSKNNHKCVSC